MPESALAGIRVVEVGNFMAAPFCALQLADLGADVVKVENPDGGDQVRTTAPFLDGESSSFIRLNRNKRSLALAALRVRDRTGRGQFIDVCLFESGVSLAVWEAGRWFATGEVPGPLGSAHQTSAPYQALRGSDGFFTLGATSATNWEACCEVFGLGALKKDPRFAKNHLRHQNRRELIPMIEKVTSKQPARHWVDALQHAGV